jgi:hypothetical protein
VTAERRSYQERVADLLERIDMLSKELLRLETAGARRPLLAELERKQARARDRLAELVSGRPRVANPARLLYL